MNVYLEIFGYIGTGLILLSMMMTSVKRLRYFNMAGSVISAIYAALMNTWPLVLLNASLVVIHIVKLASEKSSKKEADVSNDVAE
ncbi:MAG: hypothetical protein IJ515_05155 [Clostridia bacterium]|nr:hypothetical protein [Clostridia bacterium]